VLLIRVLQGEVRRRPDFRKKVTLPLANFYFDRIKTVKMSLEQMLVCARDSNGNDAQYLANGR